MKLGQGVSALSVVCAGLLVSLSLWKQAEPHALEAASAAGGCDDGALPQELDEQLAVGLADPAPELRRAAASARPAPPSADPRRTPKADEVRLCGSVQDQDGVPLADARVALFVQHSSDPDATPVCEAKCDADGSFCVSAKEAGDFVLAAFTPGLRPATRTFSVARGATQELGTIALEPGAEIEGAVYTDGEPHPNVELVAILSSTGATLRTADASLRWTRGAFEWSFTTSKNGPDGRYRIAGLRPGRYRVRITAMRGPEAIFGYRTLEAMAVDAPREDVDFKLVASTLDLRFECAREPLDAVTAELESQGVHLGRLSDERGLLRMKTLPSIESNLIVRKKGYKARVIPLETPPAGQTRRELVELEPVLEPAGLRVDLVSDSGEDVGSAQFAFFSTDANRPESLFRRAGARWPKVSVARDPDEQGDSPSSEPARPYFGVDAIPAGLYRVVIQAGPNLAGSTGMVCTPYCDAELMVTIPETGLVLRRVVLEPRGSADVVVRDARGGLLPASFKLVSNDGVEIRAISSTDHGAGRQFTEHGRLSDERPTHIYAERCSGTFVLELSCRGYAPRRVPLDLVPGIVSWIEVTLDRE